LLEPVVSPNKTLSPTPVFDTPEVIAVKAALPMAVLLPPLREPSSKAPSPKATLPSSQLDNYHQV
jgi:hypothetical protein